MSRGQIKEVAKKLKGTIQKVKRAQLVIEDGYEWTGMDRSSTSEAIRQRLVKRV